MAIPAFVLSLASYQAAGFETEERGERIVYRRSIPMVSSPNSGVSKNGVANKVREAGKIGSFIKLRTACSCFQVAKLVDVCAVQRFICCYE